GRRPVRCGLEDNRHGPWRCGVGLPAGQQGYRSGLGYVEMRELQHQDQGVCGSELQVTRAWCFALLLVAIFVCPVFAQDDVFGGLLNKLPDASYADKEEVVARLVETRHTGTRPVL